MNTILLVNNYKEDSVPMGLIYVACALSKHGYKVRFHHTERDSIHDVDLSNVLFVGFSVLTGTIIKQALSFARKIKAISPHTPIVFGFGNGEINVNNEIKKLVGREIIWCLIAHAYQITKVIPY